MCNLKFLFEFPHQMMIRSSILLVLALKSVYGRYLSCKYQNEVQNIHIHFCRYLPSYIMGFTKVYSH